METIGSRLLPLRDYTHEFGCFATILAPGQWLLATFLWIGQKQEASIKRPERDIGNPVFSIKLISGCGKILPFELTDAVC